MKRMNYFMTLIVTLLTANVLFAQEYKIPVENAKEGKLTLSNFPGNLPVEGYSGNEIIITSDRFKETPERAKGLKPVYAEGTDNTGIGLSVEKNGNQVTIHCLLPITQGGSYKIKIPDNFSLEIKGSCGNMGDVTLQNLKNEIEVNICSSINLKNVTGPLVLSTISGNIDVVFNDISKDKPTSLATVSGEIDVTLPSKTPADLEMSTVSGSMYSNFDLQSDNKEMKRVGGNSIKTKLNGGGVDLKLTNVSGNIYLRKGQ